MSVVALVLGGVAVLSGVQVARLRQQLAAERQQISSLTATNDELQRQLNGLETQRKELEGRLSELRSQLTAATGELGQLRSSIPELRARSEALEDAKATLETQVSRLTKEREEALTRIQRLEDERADVERAATRLRERFVLLDRDYQQLAKTLAQLEPSHQAVPPTTAWSPSPSGGLSSTSRFSLPNPGQTPLTPQAVELPPIVVRKDQAGAALPIRGRLVEVNEGHRFVVLDKGVSDGVRVGMTFDILRGGTTVAQAVAIRVRPQLAACDVIASRSPGTPQPGDLAIQHE
jgi:peptidoglycan hydrolase CwlO-like protein